VGYTAVGCTVVEQALADCCTVAAESRSLADSRLAAGSLVGLDHRSLMVEPRGFTSLVNLVQMFQKILVQVLSFKKFGLNLLWKWLEFYFCFFGWVGREHGLYLKAEIGNLDDELVQHRRGRTSR